MILNKRLKTIKERFICSVDKYLVAFTLVDEKKVIYCKICKLDIKPGQAIYRCPSCSSYFHKNHLLIWFNIKTICPVCKYDFTNEMSLKNKRKIKEINQTKNHN